MRRLLSVHVTYRPLIVGYVLCNVVRMVLGHGRLMEPPSRSSMWRLGYNTAHNYQDNELFCGGFQVCICGYVSSDDHQVSLAGVGISRERGWVGPVEGRVCLGRRCVRGGCLRSHGIYPVPLLTWDLGYPLPY